MSYLGSKFPPISIKDKTFWRLVQSLNHCCALNGPNDWQQVKKEPSKEPILDECCKEIQNNGKCTEDGFYTSGCVEVLYSTSQMWGWIFGGIALFSCLTYAIILLCLLVASRCSNEKTREILHKFSLVAKVTFKDDPKTPENKNKGVGRKKKENY